MANFTPKQVADQCRISGPDLAGLPRGVDGAQLLWAMAGNESSFGVNCTPRHEPAFDVGVEKDLSDYFAKYQTMQLANFKINPDEIADDGRGSIVVHSGKHLS